MVDDLTVLEFSWEKVWKHNWPCDRSCSNWTDVEVEVC